MIIKVVIGDSKDSGCLQLYSQVSAKALPFCHAVFLVPYTLASFLISWLPTCTILTDLFVKHQRFVGRSLQNFSLIWFHFHASM